MAKHLLSQLAHVEILTPKLEESANFFKELMGMEESGREGQSIYLRCWGDYYHHSLMLTQGSQPALGHIGWRTEGPEELATVVKQIEATNQGEGWYEHSVGHGRAYRFRGPGGHLNEVFWEVEHYVAPPELKSTYPARPQRFTGRGAALRMIDHVTVTTKDVMRDITWYRDTLGVRFTEYSVPDEHPDMVVFALLTTNEKSHDFGFVADFSDVPGRINHLAFFVPERSDVLRATEVLLEAGVPIEFGPGEHGMGEQFYIYFREPGGMRIELNASGYRNYVPDLEPVKWLPSQGSATRYRNLGMPDSMFESFPPAPGLSFPEPAAMADKEPAVADMSLFNPGGKRVQS
ncbi:MAG: catechol 2,3-dioxygenase [Ktedonobacteraceae bacterium]